MAIDINQLQQWLLARENEHLEFKEAKTSFEFEDLVRYCVALANEGGGRMVLGVTNKMPRRVVGTRAFSDLERTKSGLVERLHVRIHAEVISHPDGRVVVFDVPSRPVGIPMQYRGAYWMRSGDSLVPMTPDQLKKIFDEATHDFSAEICAKASFSDLDPGAIQRFRDLWHRKSGNADINTLSDEQLLKDAELVTDSGIAYAALILLGSPAALGEYLAQAEVVFEYRSSDVSGPAQQRKEYREGFFLYEDDLWKAINLRNDVQHYQDGLFVWDIPTFNEVAVREAVLNAVSHRDYRLGESVFIRQFPRRLEIVSPGGFPPGITPENILWRQSPRNRRIAEVFAKCGLVERSGQGINRMFEECIKESKPRPDFTGTDNYQVGVTLNGNVQDPRFLKFLEQIGRETMVSFTTQDLLVLDLIKREESISKELKDRLPLLRDHGVIEILGKGRGTRYLLSRRFYDYSGQKGLYTRRRGLDRETNKALIEQHIRENANEGSRLDELSQVLPHLSTVQLQYLLRSMRAEGRIHCLGRTKASRWFLSSKKKKEAGR